MNKYIKGNVVITATEKAYNSIYKEQGFIPVDSDMELPVIDTAELEEVRNELNLVKIELDETKNELATVNTELETIKGSNEKLTEDVTKLTEENEKLKSEAKKSSKSKKDEESQVNE